MNPTPNTLTLLHPLLAVVLFWVGLGLLLWLGLSVRAAQGFVRRANRAWNSLQTVLDLRCEQIIQAAPAPLPPALLDAARQARQTPSRRERAVAEQNLSRLMVPLFSDNETLSSLAVVMRNSEQQIAAQRERYNEAAATVNDARRAFPLGLVVRALVDDDQPLFDAPG